MDKPFVYDDNYAKLMEAIQMEQRALEAGETIKPFTIEPDDSGETKLYLLLLYIDDGNNSEPIQEFIFITGRQKAYDTLKTYVENDIAYVDVMKSRVLVDSPNVSISHKLSVYMFMKNMRESGKIIDDTSFDIEEYWYEEMEDNEQAQ